MHHPGKRNKGTPKDRAGDLADPFGLGFEGLVTHAPFAVMADFNTKLFTAFATASEEWAQFVAGRLQEDLRLSRDLAACQSPPEILNVYRDFYERACKDYGRGLARLAEVGQGLATDAAEAMRIPAPEPK
ncbi:MAG: phasin family protein [Hyphomicrobiaceae bacterium]